MKPKDPEPKKKRPEKGGPPNPMMMGMEMMKKMMSQMEGKEGNEGANPMQNMMGMCMGMCTDMLTAMHKTTSMAAFATPELQQLFGEWLATLEDEAVKQLREKGEMDGSTLAKALGITPEGAAYLIARLAKDGKVSLRVQAAVQV